MVALLAGLLLLLNDSASRVRSASAQLPAEGGPSQAAKPRRAEFVPGELLVRYRAGEKGARAAAQLNALRVEGRDIPVSVERVKGLELVEGLRLARVPPEETLAAVAALAARPEVLYAEPNYVRRAHAAPNDARYAEQWNLKGGLGGVGAHVRAEAAWDVTTGSRDVVVGVVDEGLEVNHPDLRDNVWRNPGEVAGNNLDDDGNGYADDVNGWDFFHEDRTVYDNPSGAAGLNAPDAHGTHVAGIVGATGNNGLGVAGVNWQVRLMSLKVLGPEGASPAPSSVLLTVRAYAYAKRLREMYHASGGALGANLRVLNNSYGGIGRSQAEFDAINELGAAGILFVASAGNDAESDDQSPSYPSSYDAPNLLNVASSDPGDGISSFSNFGARTVHLSAPGTSILSTTPGGTYSFASGTSMAAPHVSGAAALVCAARPDVSVAKLRAALLFGGDAAAAQAGRTVTGRRLNIEGALRLAFEDDAAAPAFTSLGVVTQDGRAVTLSWSAPGDDGDSSGQAQLYELRFVGPQPGDSFRLAAFRPAPAGAPQSFTVNVPYRRQSGTFVLHALDESGNSGAASVPVSVGDAAEPYAVTQGPAEPLTTGGTSLNIALDDFQTQFALPFEFPYFERHAQSVVVSTNGNLALSSAPRDDTLSYVERLEGWQMIAGLWDDLDLRACQRSDSNVYVTKEAERVVFRWQGVRFRGPSCPPSPSGEHFNFEVELRRDGTIVQRFGAGNRGGFPVVGISAGEPAAYAIASHTSVFSRLDLTNAPTVTYALRRPAAKADLAITGAPFNIPYPVRAGQEFEVPVTVVNSGPGRASGARLTTSLPRGLRLVSCQTTQGVCAMGEDNVARADFGALDAGVTARAIYVFTFEPSAAPGLTHELTHKVTSSTHETSLSDNERRTSVTSGLVNPTPLVGASALSAGGTFSLALKPDGTVLAWGSNASGQLGDGGLASFSPLPQGVRTLTGVAAVSAGVGHGLALKSSGAVWAWGDNSDGQLGDGTKTVRKKPLQVAGLSNVTGVAAGSQSLAVKSDGTVWAWGANGSGQLGDGTTTSRSAPVQVQGLSGAKAVAAGGAFSVALKSDGTVWAWGANESGQLGDGTTAQRLAPVQVSGLSNVVAVSAGRAHALALRGDGTVWAWGANNLGQLGDATFSTRETPVQVVGLLGAAAVDCGAETSVALRNDGTVWAWGHNRWGTMGDGFLDNRSAPVKTLNLRGALGVSAGAEHMLALTGGGTAWGWGNDFAGQLGDGAPDGARTWPYEVTRQVPDPLPLGTVPAPTLSPDGGTFAAPQSVSVRVAGDDVAVRSLSNGSVSTVALASDGKVYAWGSGQAGQLGLEPVTPRPGQNAGHDPLPRVQPISDVVAVAASDANHYALKSDGTVWAWGKFWGLGMGTFGDTVQLTPVQVPGLTNVKAIAAGFSHVVVARTDGTVWTWGSNNEGQLGDGTVENRYSPAQVPGLTGITDVVAKNNSTYVLGGDGRVWIWGHHDEGQFFNSFHKSPVQMTHITDVKSIGASGHCLFAVRQDGTLWAWGLITNIIRPAPFQIEGLTNVRAATGGDHFAVALKEDGTVWVWGDNRGGALGIGNFDFTTLDRPRQVPELSGVATIEADGMSVFAVESGGRLWAWGDNRFGQLGDGTVTSRSVPGTVETVGGNIRVHYTTDGREPTDDDPSIPAGGSILVGRNMTLKARAWRDGWTPSAPKSAAFQISNNQIDGSRFFVAQHYRDFLGREADDAGLDFWTGGLDSCGADAGCLFNKRVDTSAAFFLSIEFQETGFLVQRMYKTAYGEADGSAVINNTPTPIKVPVVRLDEFVPDSQRIARDVIVGTPGWPERLNNNKAAFALEFVSRPRFTDAFPSAMTPQAFVEKLNANAGGVLDAGEQQALIEELAANNNSNGRAGVLLKVAEDAETVSLEKNKAFVLMQYFGYLRRNPNGGQDTDHSGYNFWLNKLNDNGGDWRAAQMVFAFIDSIEYRDRFARP